MCAARVFTTLRRAEYAELIALFFIQGAALGMWFVPLTGVLEEHGLASIRPLAFAAGSVAAFISPLVFGAMADRHFSPVKVLRALSLATAVSMAAASYAIQSGAGAPVVLAAALEYREHGLFRSHIGLGDEIAGAALLADRFQAAEMGQQLGGARFGGASSHLSEAFDLPRCKTALLSALIGQPL